MKRLLNLVCLIAVISCCQEGRGLQSDQAHMALGREELKPIDILVPWGSGQGEVGFRPQGHEAPSEGPWSIAVGPDGGILVLDSLNGKILGIKPSGETYRAATVPWHARDVAAGPDGTMAVWSKFMSEVRVYTNGAAHIIPVPAHLRHVRGIGLSASKVVTLRSAYQERFILGSPSAPVLWPQILYTKMEGEYPWDEGRGLQVMVNEHFQPVLLLVKDRKSCRDSQERAPEEVWELDRTVNAARIVGTHKQGVSCLRFETITSDDPVEVDRVLWCGHPESKRVLLDEKLPGHGLFVPLRDGALSWDIPVAAVMWPEQTGLRIKSFVLDAGGEVGP